MRASQLVSPDIRMLVKRFGIPSQICNRPPQNREGATWRHNVRGRSTHRQVRANKGMMPFGTIFIWCIHIVMEKKALC